MIFLFTAVRALTLHVGTGYEYKSVKEAINAAGANDTVMVHGGVYNEYATTIDRPLTLLGIDRPVIDGTDAGQIWVVTADAVWIDGFEFRNSGLDFINDISALRIEGVGEGSVKNCSFKNNFFALYLARSSGITVKNNTITGNARSESRSGNGIHLWYCTDIVLTGNTVTGHRDGIYLEFVENTRVDSNLSAWNLRYGLHFMFSNKNSYHQNRFIHNGSGTAVMYSRHVDMDGNRFENNRGAAAYGLLVKDIYDSRIVNNTISGNSIGLYSEASNRLTITGNIFKNNGWAVKVMANSMDNMFSGNQFLHNSFDVATNSRQNFNLFINNYYSRYNGYDLDRDGLGDVPYRPVKLFSYLVERNEPALILMNSAFVELLNLAETVLPVLTPETLIDSQPLMEKP